jgi:hypothetical protein
MEETTTSNHKRLLVDGQPGKALAGDLVPIEELDDVGRLSSQVGDRRFDEREPQSANQPAAFAGHAGDGPIELSLGHGRDLHKRGTISKRNQLRRLRAAVTIHA